MSTARFERTLRFTATHHYRRDDWDETRNREVFGDLVDPHPHAWAVTFATVGTMAEVTGFSVDLPALDALMEELVGSWRDADLNAVVAPVREGRILPSCEALARWLFETAEGRVPKGARLAQVRVAESDEIAAVFPPESR